MSSLVNCNTIRLFSGDLYNFHVPNGPKGLAYFFSCKQLHKKGERNEDTRSKKTL